MSRHIIRAAFVLVTVIAVSAAELPPSDAEVDNVSAFARLYGVVRYFYPSDAAAELDWDRFAAYGAE